MEWGIIIFQVTFAKAPPLTHSTAFRDQVSVALTAVGTKATKRYLLSVSATDLKHQVLQRLPDGKRMTLPNLAHVSGKFVNLGVDLRPFVGGPVSVVRYRVQAARVMLDGTAGSSDYVPNHGTLVWSSAGA